MAEQKLLAKDVRRRKRRRIAVVAGLVLGGGALIALGWWLVKRIAPGSWTSTSSSSSSTSVKDWSGCGTPPAGIPAPQFGCGDEAMFGGTAVTITARTYSSGGGYGTWVYDFSPDVSVDGVAVRSAPYESFGA